MRRRWFLRARRERGGCGIAVPGDETADFRFKRHAEASAYARGHETGEREGLDAVLEANKTAKTVALITGPEGGFAPFEADLARIVGLHICSMGERILRCETAPVVATTAVMYATGNLS